MFIVFLARGSHEMEEGIPRIYSPYSSQEQDKEEEQPININIQINTGDVSSPKTKQDQNVESRKEQEEDAYHRGRRNEEEQYDREDSFEEAKETSKTKYKNSEKNAKIPPRKRIANEMAEMQAEEEMEDFKEILKNFGPYAGLALASFFVGVILGTKKHKEIQQAGREIQKKGLKVTSEFFNKIAATNNSIIADVIADQTEKMAHKIESTEKIELNQEVEQQVTNSAELTKTNKPAFKIWLELILEGIIDTTEKTVKPDLLSNLLSNTSSSLYDKALLKANNNFDVKKHPLIYIELTITKENAKQYSLKLNEACKLYTECVSDGVKQKFKDGINLNEPKIINVAKDYLFVLDENKSQCSENDMKVEQLKTNMIGSKGIWKSIRIFLSVLLKFKNIASKNPKKTYDNEESIKPILETVKKIGFFVKNSNGYKKEMDLFVYIMTDKKFNDAFTAEINNGKSQINVQTVNTLMLYSLSSEQVAQ